MGFTTASGTAKNFTQSVPTRSLNTLYVISTTAGAFVTYSVTLSASTSSSLVGTSTGTATCVLQIRPTPGSGAFTNISTVSVTNTTTFTLLVGIAIGTTDTKTEVLTGFVPAGYEVNMATTIVGTATATITTSQQETVYA